MLADIGPTLSNSEVTNLALFFRSIGSLLAIVAGILVAETITPLSMCCGM
jgi:hypothetical protein